MVYQIIISPDAIADIDEAAHHYNKLSYGLGFEFTDVLDQYFMKISHLPTASAVRYDNVRVKPIDAFPFTIHFTIYDNERIIILRVFNTNQRPFW